MAQETTPLNPTILTMDTLDNTVYLAPGDRISYRFKTTDENPKELVVSDTGELDIPFLGRILAKGKTCRELAPEIKIELDKMRVNKSTIILGINTLNKNRGIVYVAGQVVAQGPQNIPVNEVFTVSKAIMRAGGFKDYANQTKVKITRINKKSPTGVETLWVDVKSILKYGNRKYDVVLLPDDFVYVSEKTFNF